MRQISSVNPPLVKYKVSCSKCGDIIEREVIRERVTCFRCKTLRKRKLANQRFHDRNKRTIGRSGKEAR